MSNLREAVEWVLRTRHHNPHLRSYPETVSHIALDALQSAFAQTDERERARDAVIEAAQAWRKKAAPEGCLYQHVAAVLRAVDTLDALDRPAAKAWSHFRHGHWIWIAGFRERDADNCDRTKPWAEFHGESARAEAMAHAARMNERRE